MSLLAARPDVGVALWWAGVVSSFRAESERRSAPASVGQGEREGCNWVAISKDLPRPLRSASNDQSTSV